jgi:molybdopterin molybdotransferase
VPDLLAVDAARAAVLDAVRPLPDEPVPLDAALGRVLAEDVVAAADVPPFDNSAMDGFAVHAGPAGRRLRLAGESRAGAPAAAAPAPGEALAISTGAMVPPGTEAVVPVEQTERDGGAVVVTAAVTPGQHVRRAGEDVRAGDVVLRRGARLGAAELGVAAVAGRAELRCSRRPRVAIVATGDELRPPGAPLGPGQIHESNVVALAALAARAGADVAARSWVEDDEDAIRRALNDALLRGADVVVASGGVSVGPHDHVKPALDALGVEQRFWRVALRPGKPTWFGTRGDTLVFGLPGNPVSAMVTFLLFARPALNALQGAEAIPPRRTARLTAAVPRNPRRDEAVRVALEDSADGPTASPTGPQGSHQLTSMVGADGLAIVRAGEGELPAGTAVEVEPI